MASPFEAESTHEVTSISDLKARMKSKMPKKDYCHDTAAVHDDGVSAIIKENSEDPTMAARGDSHDSAVPNGDSQYSAAIANGDAHDPVVVNGDAHDPIVVANSDVPDPVIVANDDSHESAVVTKFDARDSTIVARGDGYDHAAVANVYTHDSAVLTNDKAMQVDESVDSTGIIKGAKSTEEANTSNKTETSNDNLTTQVGCTGKTVIERSAKTVADMVTKLSIKIDSEITFNFTKVTDNAEEHVEKLTDAEISADISETPVACKESVKHVTINVENLTKSVAKDC